MSFVALCIFVAILSSTAGILSGLLIWHLYEFGGDEL